MDALRQRDVRALAEFAHQTARVVRVEPRRLVPWTLAGIAELVPSDAVWQLEGRRAPNKHFGIARVRADDPRLQAARDGEEARRLWAERLVFEHPLGMRRVRQPYDFRALRLSDFTTQARFRRLEVYDRFFRPFDLSYTATVRYRGPLGFFDLSCARMRCDFSERDLMLLDLAAAVLGVAVRDPGPRLARSASAQGLTRREGDVLELVARGRTNAEIADALSIAPGTVKKHLDSVFEKLSARNRIEAARVWLAATQ